MDLSLREYRSLVGGLPSPTAEQRRNVVEYVSRAHSWYKHLPPNPPGKPFYFYVDKFAGCDCIVRPDGSRGMVERATQGFHYSSIPTAEYRARFGYLNYSCAEGTSVFFGGLLPRDKMVTIPNANGDLCFLPRELLDAGCVHLTAMIHPVVATFFVWHAGAVQLLGNPFDVLVKWPDESGGESVLQKIWDRSAEMGRQGHVEAPGLSWEAMQEAAKNCRTELEKREVFERCRADPVLYELMAPERKRQIGQMLEAIDRACALVGSSQR